MAEKLALDYFYGKEAERFVFYRIPKILFTDPRYKEISTDAKVLYGLMLDRMSLSVINGWVDEQNRVYIVFSIEEIMELMGCGNQKAVKVLAELDTAKGIGLVEKKRQGLGRPNLIYIKNFQSGEATEEEKRFKDFKQKCENHILRNVKENIQEKTVSAQKCENHILEDVEMEFSEVCNAQENNKDIRETAIKNRIDQGKRPSEKEEQNYYAYKRLIQHQIGYDALICDHPEEKERIDEIVSLLTETCCSRKETIRISGEERPSAVVRSKLIKLTAEHIRYVLGSLQANTTQIRNIRQYLLTVLYHAPETMSHYYTAKVNHDLYGQENHGPPAGEKTAGRLYKK